MTKFYRKLWLNRAAHCGIAVPIELFGELTATIPAVEKSTGVDCCMEVVDGQLIVTPVARD